MKKLILLLSIILISITTLAQRPIIVFGHSPDNYFSKNERALTLPKNFSWSIDAVVTGIQISKDPVTSVPVTQFLSGAGFAFGYKHTRLAPDSSIVADWGINIAGLTNIKVDDIVNTHLEIALLANIYQFTFGPAYIFKENKFAFLTGVTINF